MGGVLTNDERIWLDEYKRANPVGRPPVNRTNHTVSDPPIGIVNQPDFQNPVDSAIPPPLLIGPPIQTSSESAEDAGPAPEFAKSDSDVDEKPDVSADEIYEKQGAALADKYCEAIKIVGRRVTALGGFAIPDEIVDTALNFAAKGTFTRYAKRAGELMSEESQDKVVVIAGAGMYLQEYLLKQYRAKNPLASSAPAQAKQEPVFNGRNGSPQKTVLDIPVRSGSLRQEG